MRSFAYLGALATAVFLCGAARTTYAAAPPPPDHMFVAPFERFYGDAKTDAAVGGELLLGELNCLSCHQAAGLPAGYVRTKQAPILSKVGQRVRPEYMAKFLADPQKVKPGTTMPQVLAGLPEAERAAAIPALVSLLASTGKTADEAITLADARAGETLYHTLGCVACHGLRKDNAPPQPGMVPLGVPSQKYTLGGLTEFLLDPLAVRPAARMPHFGLNKDDARQLAAFLLQDLATPGALEVSVYEGAFDKLPNFSTLKPKAVVAADNFDLGVAKLSNNFALRFVGKINIEKAAEYTFFLTSDDGSRLLIDGQPVVNDDGIHPAKTESGKVKLTAGPHDLVVEFFEAKNEEVLKVEFDAGGGKRPLETLLRAPLPAVAKTETPFVPSDALTEQGRKYFTTLGCAACHQLQNPGKLKAKITAPSLANMKSTGGCLAEAPGPNTPHFALNARQRTALAAALEKLRTPPPALSEKELVARTLVTFNCHACHERGDVGGPQEAVAAAFVTTEPEMGDEGRLPPALDGVGAKLKPTYLQKIFARGAKDRPYMLARMPKFGSENLDFLVPALEKVDVIEPLARPAGDLPEKPTKQIGRQLVGDKGYSCMKCHTWDKLHSEGVQAISLTLMHERLREEWFRRYVIDPPKYRPGTRMPSAWPNGQAMLKKILDGNAEQQVYAVWWYLEDGAKAPVPSGYVTANMELVPLGGEAVIYRNFIEGGGPRAIGVGYPEKVNLVWDANDLRLALLWKDGFIDASKHWVNRGQGFQSPLGDSVHKFEAGPPLAVLASEKDTWPTKSARTPDSGLQFHGYTLDEARRPKFRYSFHELQVEDFFQGVDDAKQGAYVKRTLAFSAPSAPANLYFRVGSAKSIGEPVDGIYALDDGLHVRVQAAGKPEVRGNQLLVPVVFENGKSLLTLDYHW